MGNSTSSEAPKVLMVFTSHDKLGDTEEKTGWYLPEAAHPYAEFTKAGYKIEMASPKGGEAPLDASSIEASKEDQLSVDFAEKEEFTSQWKATKKLADCKSADYAAVFVVGGFGVMWDLPDDADMIRLAQEIYAAGNVVSAVCHGPAALVNVKLSNGDFLAKGKKVSAFTNAEEDAVKRREVVPWTCEDKYTEIGAEFVDGGVFQVNVCVAERLVTGQNPPSAGATAEAVIKLVNLKLLLTEPDKDVPSLYYFDLAGRAEPIRMAFVAGGVRFNDIRVERADWKEHLKPTMKTHGGQLPALKHKGVTVGQSMAILNYAGALGKLNGENPLQQLKVGELCAAIEDVFKATTPTFSMKDGPEKLAARAALAVEGSDLYKALAKFEDYAEANGKNDFLVGAKMTTADLALVGTVGLLSNGWLDGMPQNVLKPFPNLCEIVRRVLGSPKIAEYYKGAEGHNTIFQLDTFNAAVASE